jgi:hypothetical protein
MNGLTAQIQAMAAMYDQSRSSYYWVSSPMPLTGNDVPISPAAVIAIVQNPNSSALAVGIGHMTYSIPAYQLEVFPTLRAIVLTSAGPGTVVFSSRYEDRGFVSSSGLI